MKYNPLLQEDSALVTQRGVGWSHTGNTPLTITEDEGRQFPLGEVPRPPLAAPLY